MREAAFRASIPVLSRISVFDHSQNRCCTIADSGAVVAIAVLRIGIDEEVEPVGGCVPLAVNELSPKCESVRFHSFPAPNLRLNLSENQIF